MSERCPVCGGDAGDNHFDRSLCACGAMHTRCNACGYELDGCPPGVPADHPELRPPLVSVLTPTIPGRERMLAECVASVAAQTVQGYEHLTWLDQDRDGCAVTMNRLARQAKGEWLLPLADDDLLLPGCLDTLLERAGEADVVYAPPLVSGNEDRWWFFQSPPAIPAVALVRASLWAELGGYDEKLRREEDRDLWTRALESGARFVRVAEPCWVYRQHAGNKSFQRVAVAA